MDGMAWQWHAGDQARTATGFIGTGFSRSVSTDNIRFVSLKVSEYKIFAELKIAFQPQVGR